jgi:hypothetical protein
MSCKDSEYAKVLKITNIFCLVENVDFVNTNIENNLNCDGKVEEIRLKKYYN